MFWGVYLLAVGIWVGMMVFGIGVYLHWVFGYNWVGYRLTMPTGYVRVEHQVCAVIWLTRKPD